MLSPDNALNRFQAHLNYSNGNTYWDFGDIGSGGRVSMANPPGTLGNWTHYALVGSATGNFMKIYVNGVEAATVASFNAFETATACALRIGGSTSFFYDGSLDDFRIWNVARTQAEIARDLGGPLTGSEPGLRLYLKFDEGTGATTANSATATAVSHPSGTLMGTNPTTMWSTPARTTYTVTNTSDTGAGSLRQAITDAAAASGPALITFAPALSGQTITLTGPLGGTAIAINDAGGVTIDATSLPGGLTINDGTATTFRLFSVASGTSLTLRGLTLANGGGGDFFFGGGAISNEGTLTLTQCTLSGNSANYGGAIRGSGTLTHCTLTGNTASNSGGAIDVLGTVTLIHCTVAGNSAGGSLGGGGVYVSDGPTLVMENSIVAGNTLTGSGTGPDIRIGLATVTATGANLVQTAIAGTGTVNGTGTISTAAPLLAPLASNGGPTKTMALLPGSPAIDAATVIPGLTTDQRGLPRSRDGDATAGAAPDIGAYEAQVAPVGSLGFNFNGANPRDLLATESAGAPGFAQTHWNNLIGDFGFGTGPRTLSGGGLVTVRTDWDAPNTYAINFGTPTTTDQKLMWGYLDSNSALNAGTDLYQAQNQPFFALADLPASLTLGGYRVVVYADTEAAASDRVGEYWLTTHSGTPGNVTGTTDLSPHLFLRDDTNFSGTYTRLPATSLTRDGAASGNYLVFENQTQPAFMLRTEENPSFRTAINAVQLVRNEILVVTTTADENDPVGTPGTGLSLREAVALAPDGAGIVFDSALSGATITLGSEILLIEKNVTIDASSLPGGVTLDGGPGSNRIFFTDKTVTLKNLTLTGGGGTGLYGSGAGGAIRDNGGTLTLERCTLSDNSASSGGAINSGGTLTLTTLTHCTLSGNSAGNGGAIHCPFGTLTLSNSIVAGNTATNRGPDIFGIGFTITPTGVNLIGNLADTALTAGPTVIVAAPLLAPLGNYGGPTQTMPPLPGSPAIDAAAGSTATTDQRGFARPQDGDGNGNALADIGAVERSAPPVVTTTADSGPGSLRQAIDGAAIEPGMETITFAPGFTGSIMLGSEIVIGSDVHINAGSIASGVTINGGPGTNRIFTVNSGTTVTLQNLALTGGNGSGGGGGAILNNGTLSLTQCLLFGNSGTFAGAIENNSTLTLTDCALTGNSATSFGAGAIDNSSSLTLLRCTFSGNTGNTFGGAIHHNTAGSTLSLTHCTFSGNTATTAGGGAIFMNAGTATLTHCTLAGNTASSGDGGGAIRQSGGTLTLTHSIVAANTAGTNADIRCTAGTTTATGVNLIGNLTGSNLTEGTTVLVGAPLLAPLGNYGGPTQTMALLPGSPARNAATGSSITTDQRGFPIVGVPDIGAYEAGTFNSYTTWIWETLPTAGNGLITDPLHAATFDFDGDGQNNNAEWLALTSPANPNSRFTVTTGVISGGNLNYSFPSALGRTYTVEYTTDLTAAWQTAPGTITGTGSVINATIGPVTGFNQYFIRIRAALPP